jgi:hypothetical protein
VRLLPRVDIHIVPSFPICREDYTMLSLILLIIPFALMACGGPKNTSLTPVPSKDVLSAAPDWYLSVPTNEDQLYAVGSATSRNMQTALDKAQLVARGDFAQQLSTRVAGLTKQFVEETGLGDSSSFLTHFSNVTKAVTQETVVGSRIDEQKLVPERDIYRAYVLMSLPLGSMRQLLLQRIEEDRELTHLRATKAFEELERELQGASK